MRAINVEIFDNVLCESFPTFAAMATGEMCLDGQCIVEQEHALARPAGEVAACGDAGVHIIMRFFEDIL